MGLEKIYAPTRSPLLQRKMTFGQILIFLAACYGFSVIIATIVADTRFDRKPFSCPLCTSFWIALVFIVARFFFGDLIFFNIVLVPFAASGVSYMINRFVTGDF